MNAASAGEEKADFQGGRLDAERLAQVLDAVGPESLERLLGECRRRLETLVDELQRANLAECRKSILAGLHRLRGSSASLGLKALSRALAMIERDITAAEDASLTAACAAAATNIEHMIEMTWAELAAGSGFNLPLPHGTGDLKR